MAVAVPALIATERGIEKRSWLGDRSHFAPLSHALWAAILADQAEPGAGIALGTRFALPLELIKRTSAGDFGIHEPAVTVPSSALHVRLKENAPVGCHNAPIGCDLGDVD
jgi:hypothetical protein